MDRPAFSSPPTRDWWWVFDPRHSLRAAAALLFGVGGALFTVLLAWLGGRGLEQTLLRRLGQNFETLAVQVSDKIDRTIYERYRTLQLTAGLAAFRSYEATAADRRRLLAQLQDNSPDFVWLGFVDPQGRIAAATRGHLEGTAAENRAWFRGARETAYAGNVREAAELPAGVIPLEEGETRPHVLDLAVPVADPDGRFAGVLAAQVRWGWARTVQSSIVTEADRRERIGITLYSEGGDVLLDSGSSGWNRPPDLPAVSDRRQFRGHQVEPTALGTTYVTGYSRSRGYREYRGLGWVAAVRQPLDFAFQPVREFRRTVTGWGLAFTLTGMAVAWYFAGFVSQRLRAIQLAADRIHTGDVLAMLPPGHGESELAQMCAALGRLIESLRPRPDDSPEPPLTRPPRSPR
ncbi:MAG: cache domain-containing protein [Verrucomicrobia bacterium]|nr:cache domain-containing protein [Verrucomicrobiota bacterium]